MFSIKNILEDKEYFTGVVAIIVTCFLVCFGLYHQFNKLVDTKVNVRALVLAEELSAKQTQEQIELLGHKYCDSILARGVMFINKNEQVKGTKTPTTLVDPKKYVEKLMVLESTAYWTHDPVEASGDGIAFDGTPAIAYKTCAVDPKVIPLGSEIYVPTIGWMRANDTGNMIKGKIIDLAMPSRDDAWNWGRRYCYCKVRMPRKS